MAAFSIIMPLPFLWTCDRMNAWLPWPRPTKPVLRQCIVILSAACVNFVFCLVCTNLFTWMVYYSVGRLLGLPSSLASFLPNPSNFTSAPGKGLGQGVENSVVRQHFWLCAQQLLMAIAYIALAIQTMLIAVSHMCLAVVQNPFISLIFATNFMSLHFFSRNDS